jgi:hypothetical protein
MSALNSGDTPLEWITRTNCPGRQSLVLAGVRYGLLGSVEHC